MNSKRYKLRAKKNMKWKQVGPKRKFRYSSYEKVSSGHADRQADKSFNDLEGNPNDD